MKSKKIIEKVPDIILAQLSCFSIVYGLTSSLCLTYPPLKLLLWIVSFITILFILFQNKKTSLAFSVILGLAFTAGVIYVVLVPGMEKAGTFLEEYFYWLNEFIQYPDLPVPLYQNITAAALIIAVSVFSYIFIIKRFLFIAVASAGIGLFAVQTSYDIISTLVPFYIFLLLTLIAWLKHVYLLKSSKSQNEFFKPPVMIAWSIPICIVIFFLAYAVKEKEKPIEWKWLDKKVISAYNYFNNNMNYEVFDYFSLSSSSGFGDRDNHLGGRVRLDKTNVLEVTTNRNIYLKGATRDLYTGTTWTNRSQKKYPMDNPSNQESFYSEIEEMMFGMYLLTGEEDFIEKNYEKNEVAVKFLNLKTRSLFIPSKVTDFITGNDKFITLKSSTDDLFASSRLSKGFAYNVSMFSPNIGTEEFEDIMRKSSRGLYASQADYIFSSNSSASARPVIELELPDAEKVISLRYKSYNIYRDYLQLPVQLPQRVRDLSASLVAPYQNNYDKAKAIEQFLATKYPYTLDVRSTPRNRDFVDYFLFDLNEGYCSYYASAMVILARCAGIPARYVEGYMLPPNPTEEDGSTYIVTNMQAHAWVEIYFEGYGWLPFEPTAPFRSAFYSNRSSEPLNTGAFSSTYNDYMEMLEDYRDQDDMAFEFEGNTTVEKSSSKLIVLIVFGSIVLFLLILLLFNTIRMRFKLYKLVSLPAKKCVLNLYEYYVYILGLQGLGYRAAETPLQYSERIDSFMFFSPVKFKVITDIFMKSRYSRKDATEKEKQLFCEFHDSFMEEIKTNTGKLRYFAYKYVLGRF